MIKNNYGRIVNIASVSGKDGNANASAYSLAKAGVLGLTKSLGKELAQYNIAVNAVTRWCKNKNFKSNDKRTRSKNVIKSSKRKIFRAYELSSCLLAFLRGKLFFNRCSFDISGGRSTY